MRVLHFAKTFSPLSETFIYDYVTELERQGVDNHVFALDRKNEESRPFSKVKIVERPGRWNPRRLWHRLLVATGTGDPRTAEWPQLRERLEAVVHNVQPDVIHAHFGPAGVLIGSVAKTNGIPLVVSFHGFDAFKLPTEPFWKKKYSGLFGRADCITVVSNLMAQHLTEVDAPSDKVTVIRVGKHMEEYPYRPPTSPVRNWISVGRLEEKKGFEDCIDAFRHLVGEYPASTLDIIGDGSRYDALQERIASTGLAENVRLLGRRPHSEVKRKLDSVDAFVLCSREADDGNREGVPTVLMEAQAIGLPVVSTTHSGIPEVIPGENQTLLAPEGDVGEIANRMSQLARESVDRLQDLSQQGREKIEQDFNLSNEVGKLKKMYCSLEEEGSPHGCE